MLLETVTERTFIRRTLSKTRTLLALASALTIAGCATPYRTVSETPLKNEQGHVIGYTRITADTSGRTQTITSYFTPIKDNRGNVVGYEENLRGDGKIMRDIYGRKREWLVGVTRGRGYRISFPDGASSPPSQITIAEQTKSSTPAPKPAVEPVPPVKREAEVAQAPVAPAAPTSDTASIQKYEAEIATYRGKLDELERRLQEVEKNYRAAREEADKYKAQLDVRLTEIRREYEGKFEQSKAREATLEAQYNELLKKRDVPQAEPAAIAELKAKIISLEARIDEVRVEERRDAGQRRGRLIADCNATIAQLQGSLATKDKELATAKASLEAALKAQQGMVDAAVAPLQRRVEQLTADYNALKGQSDRDIATLRVERDAAIAAYREAEQRASRYERLATAQVTAPPAKQTAPKPAALPQTLPPTTAPEISSTLYLEKILIANEHTTPREMQQYIRGLFDAYMTNKLPAEEKRKVNEAVSEWLSKSTARVAIGMEIMSLKKMEGINVMVGTISSPPNVFYVGLSQYEEKNGQKIAVDHSLPYFQVSSSINLSPIQKLRLIKDADLSGLVLQPLSQLYLDQWTKGIVPQALAFFKAGQHIHDNPDSEVKLRPNISARELLNKKLEDGEILQNGVYFKIHFPQK
jgi:hypothetical protein